MRHFDQQVVVGEFEWLRGRAGAEKRCVGLNVCDNMRDGRECMESQDQ